MTIVGVTCRVGAGAAPAYSPAGEGNLTLRLDASSLSSLWQDSGGGRTTPVAVTSDPVGGWNDIRGNGMYVNAASDAKRGTYNPNGVGTGKPGVTFDGVDDVMSSANATLTAGMIFAVYKLTTFAALSGPVKVAPTATDAATGNGVVMYSQNVTRSVVANPAASTFSARDNSPAQANGGSAIWVYSWGVAPASSVFRRNLAALTPASSGGALISQTSPTPIHVGIGYATGYIAASFGEVLVYSAALDAAAISRVETYLRAKWGTP
jgi:hypothetical protein